MEFFNPNGRILVGKLQVPLADGQVVTGFALDVDGQLRDAVPVEKARAQQVFEANFYGHRQQVLTSSTCLMMWLSSGYGSAHQRDRARRCRCAANAASAS